MPTSRQTALATFAAAVVLWISTRRAPDSQIRIHAPALATAAFDRADHDGDGLLSPAEFAYASAELSPRGQLQPQHLPPQLTATPTVSSQSGAATVTRTLSTPATFTSTVTPVESAPSGKHLPQCSILFFYHIVKTAGTTMRTVLQRQAQLGDFEYVYTDTTRKPRWQLLMHQLTHPVAKRRIIIELHSEWGLPRAFFADVRRIRGLYEPLGCTVTLATVLRHPLSFYLSWFNWRASNYMPLCLWDPPRDPQSRQLSGFGLPFVTTRQPDHMGGRRLRLPVATVLSVLKHFDVVGLTERFDESLLLIGRRAGMRHLGYARLAENLKPEHPRAARRVLQTVLSDAGVAKGLNGSFAFDAAERGFFAPDEQMRSMGLADGAGGPLGAAGAAGGSAAGSDAEKRRSWSQSALDAMRELNAVSLNFVVSKNARRRGGPEKADCNFYPCAEELSRAGGFVSEGQCAADGRGSPQAMLSQMLDKTRTDRAVHAYAVRRLEQDLALMERASAASGGPSVGAQLGALREQSADVQRRRLEQIGRRREKLCGVRLCGTPLRSCVGCEPNPVPGMEPCWPSWEDQFAPDERTSWCKRSMTIPGYDALEIAQRTYPKIDKIPCWRTCWEAMTPNASQPHGTNPTCLERDGPRPDAASSPGPSCARREVHCSPGCTPAFPGTLKQFWEREWLRHPDRPADEAVGIACPCGQGG